MIARACDVPGDSLLASYASQAQTYTDCFEVMHPLQVTLPAFIDAFYGTALFRLERLVLRGALRRPITDAQKEALAQGQSDRFAAWRVEARSDTQILLCDMSGHTRSWLAVSAKQGSVTRLLFGSAVVPAEGHELSWMIRATIPLHRLYSKLLLRSAERKLRRG